MKKLFTLLLLSVSALSFSQTEFEIKEFKKVYAGEIKVAEYVQPYYVKVGIKGSDLPLYSDVTVLVKFSEDWTFKQANQNVMIQLNNWLAINYPTIPCKK